MLVLLPPSEGKTTPDAGEPLDLASMSSPGLTATRELILRTVVKMCAGNQKLAAERLGIGPTQQDEVVRNAALLEAPAGRADAIYTGVLYDNWNPTDAGTASRAHADRTVAIASALFGVVRASDRIPAYRLSAGTTLPRIGVVDARWRQPLGKALAELTAGGLLLDLRSGAYVNLHKPAGDLAARTATVRVLTDVNGVRKVVSHFNKATKGQIVRALCDAGVEAATVDELDVALKDLGWTVERDGQRLDVIT